MGHPVHLPCVLAQALALAQAHLPSSSGVWSFRGSDNPRDAMPAAWHPPPKKIQNQSKIVSFLNPFSNAFLDRFLVHFASQLASQKPSKSMKNRCQDASQLGFHFCSQGQGGYPIGPSDGVSSGDRPRCSQSTNFEKSPFQVNNDF